jgi:hypothetical protein
MSWGSGKLLSPRVLYRWVLQFGHLGYPQFVHGSTEIFMPLLPQMHWKSCKLYISAQRPTPKSCGVSRAYHSRISRPRPLVFWQEGALERAAANSMGVGRPQIHQPPLTAGMWTGRRHCMGFLGMSRGSLWVAVVV